MAKPAGPGRARARQGSLSRARLAAVRVALLLERLSRRLYPVPPRPPVTRDRRVALSRELALERPLHAARRPPKSYEFIPQDEFFERVECLLRGATLKEP